MSENTGAISSETLQANGGAAAQTEVGTGAGVGQTVSQEELQKLQSQMNELLKVSEDYKKQLSSRDAKIAELQKLTEAKTQDNITLESLQAELVNERTARVRTEFALKNGVTDDLLSYLQGSNTEELSNNWKALSGLIDAKAEEKRKAELGKLGAGVTNASINPKVPLSDEELLKSILTAK